jgi:small subunit ribosomal protein S20
MANHKSAKTRIRRNERRAVINGNRVSRIRTFIKKVMTAIEAGDAKAADEALKNAQPEIYRGVSKGVLKKQTAARKMSRLSARVKALKTQA